MDTHNELRLTWSMLEEKWKTSVILLHQTLMHLDPGSSKLEDKPSQAYHVVIRNPLRYINMQLNSIRLSLYYAYQYLIHPRLHCSSCSLLKWKNMTSSDFEPFAHLILRCSMLLGVIKEIQREHWQQWSVWTLWYLPPIYDIYMVILW